MSFGNHGRKSVKTNLDPEWREKTYSRRKPRLERYNTGKRRWFSQLLSQMPIPDYSFSEVQVPSEQTSTYGRNPNVNPYANGHRPMREAISMLSGTVEYCSSHGPVVRMGGFGLSPYTRLPEFEGGDVSHLMGQTIRVRIYGHDGMLVGKVA